MTSRAKSWPSYTKDYYDTHPSKRTQKEYISLLPIRQSTNSHLAELALINPSSAERPYYVMAR